MSTHRSRVAVSFAFAVLAATLANVAAEDQATVLTTFSGHTEPVYGVAVSPDGKLVATGSLDKSVRLFDARTGNPIRTFAGPQGHQKMVLTVAFSPDGRTLASGGEDNLLKLWDVPSDHPLRTLVQKMAPHSIALSPDGARLAVGGKDGILRIFNVADAKELLTLPGHTQVIARIAWSANGQVAATAGQDQMLRFWNAANGQPLGVVGAHRDGANNIALHPNGAAAYSVGQDGLLKFWTLPLAAPRALAGHNGDILALALSGDGSQVLTGGADKTVRGFTFANNAQTRTLTGLPGSATAVGTNGPATLIAAGTQTGELLLWNGADNQLLATHPAHAGGVATLSFAPNNAQLLTGGGDGLLKTWLLPPLPAIALDHPQMPLVAQPSADGKKLLTGCEDGAVRLWDISKKAVERQFVGHAGPVAGVAFHPGNQLLYSAGADGTLRMWNIAAGKESGRIGAHLKGIASLALHPGGSLALTSAQDGAVKFWQIPPTPVQPFVHADQVTCLAVSADGAKMVTGCADRHVRIWNLASGAKERDLAGPTLPVACVALSRDGKIAAAGSADQSVYVWSTIEGEGKLLHSTKLAAAVQALVLSPDAKQLVAGLGDGKIVVLDPATGKEILALAKHTGPVTSLAFTPKGDVLLSGGGDGAVQWFAMPEGKLTRRQDRVALKPHLAVSNDGQTFAVANEKEVALWKLSAGQTGPGFQLPAKVHSVQFAPDGKRLIVGCADNRAYVYAADGTLLEYLGHDGPVLDVAFADARRIVTASADKQARLWAPALRWHQNGGKAAFTAKGEQVLIQRGGSVVFCNAADGRELQALAASDQPLIGFAVNQDAAKLATLGDGVKVWSLIQNKAGALERTTPLHAFPLDGKANAAAFSPSGSRLAVSSAGKDSTYIRLFDLPANREVFKLPGGKASAALAFLADNRTLAVSKDNTVRLSDTGVASAFDAHPGGVGSVQYHINGAQALSAGKDNTVKLWDLAKGVAIKTWGPLAEPVRAAVFSRDFTQIGAAAGKMVHIWNVADGKELHTLSHPADVLSLSFNNDKTRLATGGADKMTRIWDLTSGQELQFVAQSDPVRAVAFHNNNSTVLSAAGSKNVAIDTIAAARVLKAASGPLTGLALTPNGAQLLTGGPDKQITQWNAGSGAKERTIPAPTAIQTLTVSKNNVLVAAAGADQVVRIFNFGDGKEVKSAPVAAAVRSLAFSPNNATLAAACDDGVAQAWNAIYQPGQPVPADFLKPLQSFKHGAAALDAVFAGDNQTLWTCGLDKNVLAWKIALDAPIKQFGHPQNVACVAYHASGTKLATGAADGKVRIYDIAKGAVLKEINAHPTPNQTIIYAVAWHPTLDQIATAGYDGSVKLFDATSGNLVQEFRRKRIFFVDFPGHGDSVYNLAFSPDGRYLASASAGQECLVKIWNLQEKTVTDLVNPKMKRAPGFEQSHPGWIYGLRYTSDGKHLVSAGGAPGNKGYLAVWDAPAGKLVAAEEFPHGVLYSLELLPGNRTALVGAGPRGKAAKDLNKAYVLTLPK